MQLPHAFIQLPLRFDAACLAAEIAALGEVAWRPHPQGFAGNDALPLVAAHGDPDDDATAGPMAATPWLRQCPCLREVLASFGSCIGRTRLMRIVGDGDVQAHADISYYWWERVRIHIPLVTAPEVRFYCGEQAINMAAGTCWIFDTWREHRVRNHQPQARIHLVIDTTGSAHFWSLVAAGRVPGAEPLTLQDVSLDPEVPTPLHFEAINRPAVMTPWELSTIAAWFESELEREAIGSASERANMRAALATLIQDWRDLWGRYGATAQGLPGYRACLTRLWEAVQAPQDLRFPNNVAVLTALRSLIVEAALGDSVRSEPGSNQRRPSGARQRLKRSIFVVCPPRSGSTLLFETLAQAPNLYTIGGESHGVIEGIASLSPARRQWASNRLLASDADRETARALAAAFLERAHDRDGRAPPPSGALRLLEKTPKNALRVPFLAEVFPHAMFVYLYRDPRETISSMLDAWRSGRFVTYPALPGWTGLPWSLLLVPGWQHLRGRELAEIVALQWAACVEILLDDMEKLPPHRWCVADYARLVAAPQQEIERLCGFLRLPWDRRIESPLPLSRYTLHAPNPDKWQRNAQALEIAMPLIAKTAARARDLFGRPPDTSTVVAAGTDPD